MSLTSRRPKTTRVAIVGAGMSGIAMAVKLKQAGYGNFTVFEKSPGAGGTWYDSRFPGAAVDVHSHCYSYPFNHYDWTTTHADAWQVRDYLNSTIDQFGIRRKFRFETKVEAAVWDESKNCYDVQLGSGERLQFDVVVSCLGLLNNPSIPKWPGLERFTGPAFHSARWQEQHDFSNKRVAVVGFGSSAAQIVPGLAPNAKEVVLFARTPSWILPKPVRPFTERERLRYKWDPFFRTWRRYVEFKARENPQMTLGIRRAEGPEQEEVRARALKYLEETIEDPDLRTFLTPSFPVGCKRIILDSNFYPSLNRENVTVVRHGVSAVDESGIIDSLGVHHQVDAIVMATGFTTVKYLATLEVKGFAGRSIHDIWSESPRAFCGLTVPGVPNFFMLYGPNTNGGISLMSNATRQAEAVIATISRMEREHATAFDTRPSALMRWNEWVDEGNKTRTSTHQKYCTNYYYSSTGENVTQLPTRYIEYALALKLLFQRGIVLQPSS